MNSGEPGRTPPNSGERSAYSGERSPEFGGVSVLANRWRVRAEFARVRSSSPEFARVRGERQFAGYTAYYSANHITQAECHRKLEL